MSKFFIDSNSELWYTRAEELGVEVIGMPYTLDEDDEIAYDLGKNTDFEEFYDRIRKGACAKTQALNTQNYLDYFEPVLAAGEDIIYIHFSSKMSGTFKQMEQAIEILKEKYPERKILTADTLSISLGEALMVYDCAKMWKAGVKDEDIIRYVEEHRNNYAVNFIVEDLGHLKRGGRLSTMSCIFGTMLNIKPILKINENGEIVKASVSKGLKKGIKDLVQSIKDNGTELDKHPIVIGHACAEEYANELKELINAEFPQAEVWVQKIGPTIGSHCGPGTFGIAFYTKAR